MATLKSKVSFISGNGSSTGATTGNVKTFSNDGTALANYGATVYVTDCTVDGIFVIALNAGATYIVSTQIDNLDAYGINQYQTQYGRGNLSANSNMKINTMYQIMRYSSSATNTNDNPRINSTNVRSTPASYMNAISRGPFSLAFDASKDLYIHVISGAVASDNTLFCVPYETRINKFTRTTLTAGNVHAVYMFNAREGFYSMKFHPLNGYLCIAALNKDFVYILGYGTGGTATTIYGISVMDFAGNQSTAYTLANYTGSSVSSPICICFDANYNMYVLSSTSASVYETWIYFYDRNLNNTILGYAYTTTPTPIRIKIGLRNMAGRPYGIEFDSKNNLYYASDNGKLYVLPDQTTYQTANIMGITMSNPLYERNAVDIRGNVSVLINGTTSTALGNVNIDDTNLKLAISTQSIVLDKRTGDTFFLIGYFGLRQIVNQPSAPSYILITIPGINQIKISKLGGNIVSNYNKGYPLTKSYYSTDGTTFTSVSAAIDDVTFTPATSGSVTVTVKSENIVGNSAASSRQVFVYQTPTRPIASSFSWNSSVKESGNITINVLDTTTVAANYNLNDVYYWIYTINGTPDTVNNSYKDIPNYGNSGTGYVASPATTTIKITGIATPGQYTSWVIAKNPISVSSVPTNKTDSVTATVLVTPVSFSTLTASSTTSGVISGTITDPATGYNYTNNSVTYFYYLYNGTPPNNYTVPNVYANTNVAVRTSTNVGPYSYSITTTAGTYTLYMFAKNDVGNSVPTTINSITVLTTPVSFSYTASNPTSGNITFTINDSTNSTTNSVQYYYYLYNGVSTNNYTDPAAYTTDIGVTRTVSTPGPYTYTITGLSRQQYTVYLMAKNSIGNSVFTSGNVIEVYTTPSSPTMLSTASNTAKQLTISVSDSTNSITNQVYYTYSLNGTTYGNSGNLYTGAGTYTFTISTTDGTTPINDINYTLYVRGSNTVGNSSAATQSVVVYQTPQTPTTVAWDSATKQSGNIKVNITDSPILSNYDLNNVYYFYYLYSSGQNSSGDINAYSNSLAKYSSSGADTATFTISGQTAGSYTLYVAAKNTVGNSVPPATGNAVTVLTTPVSFDSYTASNPTSGNISITITDNQNSTTNSVKYYYYLYNGVSTNNYTDPNAYSTDIGVTRTASAQGPYTYTITGLSRQQYTIYLMAKNDVGNSVATSPTTIDVYTTPSPPTITSTASNTAKQLTINLSDSTNSSTNQVYYTYSLNGTTYGNSGILKTSSTTYSFNITTTDGTTLINDISYILYVRGTNTVGNSSATTQSVVVYQTPQTPTTVVWDFATIQSGNIKVNITDSPILPNYDLNNVYYFYYLYSSGQNSSGDINAYSNSLAKYSSSGADTATFTISGQTTGSYTLYVAAKNTVGNSVPPATGNAVTVLTTPVSFDSYTATNPTSGNITLTINDTTNSTTNSVKYYYYLYNGVSTNNYTDPAAYSTDIGVTRTGSSLGPYTYTITGLSRQQYTLYLMAKNDVGNSVATSPTTIEVYTTPATPTISSTSSDTAKQLTINLSDSTNSSTNQVYYTYSLNGTAYGNSGILKTSSTTYSFNITTTDGTTLINDISYTLYVRGSNTVGNSSTATQSVVVYQTPQTPTTVAWDSATKQSGNIKVNITDSPILSNYDLNNVYYFYYLYSSGQNNSSNINAYSNSLAKYSSSGADTATFTISGQTAGSYTLYVAAKNTVGNSVPPATGNAVTVLTTPVSFDSYTASNPTSGNISITITDNQNSTTNSVKYYYYLYNGVSTNNYADPNSYTTDIGVTRTGSSMGPYTYTITGLSHQQYSLYLMAKNDVGNSVATNGAAIEVYTTPTTPTISSTSSNTAKQLTINLSDSTNSITNQVYYTYSLNGTTYGNSGILKTSSTTYSFNITTTDGTTPINDISYTLYVRGTNTVGNSSAATQTVVVYQTPQTPTTVVWDSATKQSGNIKVNITDSPILSNYNLNNVYYFYYLYSSGQNSSGDINAYSNSLAKYSSSGANTATFTISGQTAGSYTLYVAAKNTVGNSVPPATGNAVTVLTTPVSFDSYTASNPTSGNISITITDNQNSTTNSVKYYYYLYNGVSTNNYTDPNAYTTDIGITRTGSSMGPYTYTITGLSRQQYSLYLMAKNDVGNSVATSPSTIEVYTTPSTPTISSTASNTAKQLTINLSDSTNSITNQVYYTYSLNGTTYGNSGVLKTSSTTYSFNITTTDGTTLINDISYTLYVRGTNTVGNSSAATQSVVVYQTPQTPTTVAWDSATKQSGNIKVNITDSPILSNYNLNNVYYFYYLYRSGQNNSSNINAYSNSLAKYSSSGSDTATFTISGQTAGSYTLYVAAKNTVGNSVPPATGNAVTVLTTPMNVSITSVTTPSSGTLRVFFTDTANDYRNNITYYYYYYRTGDISPNNSTNINSYTASSATLVNGTTNYSITISSLQNAQYTLYISAKNDVGNSVAASTAATCYVTPSAPNSVSITNVASGNLQVTVTDTTNAATNAITYLYYAYATNSTNNSTQISSYLTGGTLSTSPTVFYINPLSNNTYSVYVVATNPIGNTIANPVNSSTAMVYVTPSAPTIDSLNTYSSSGGEITVSLYDTTNSAINDVYYFYSTTNSNYANSFVKYTGTSQYNLYSFKATGLTNGTAYTIYVQARNPVNNSSYVTTSSIMVYTVPNAPVLTQVAKNQSAEITFTTSFDGGNTITAYEYSVDSGSYINIGIPANNKYTIPNLTNGQTYTIVGRSLNARGYSNPSTSIQTTPYGLPNAPTIYGTSTSSSIIITFDAPASNGNPITKYRISYNTTNTNNYADTSPALPVNNTLTITGVVFEQKYYIRMRAVNAAGESSDSNTLMIATSNLPFEPTITTLVPLDGQIQIVLTPPSYLGGNDVLSYKYAVLPL
jgi:hypothetical protein